jgi:ubiquinone/menaquinone biosynthesis C-methylase UbiE
MEMDWTSRRQVATKSGNEGQVIMAGIPRVLEPEYMDTSDEATEYDTMDHSTVNRKFVQDLVVHGELGRDVLDLGTGTARIPIELCRVNQDVRIMASDAAVSMLDLARYNIEVESLIGRIFLHNGDSKHLVFEEEYFDTVISNSLVHHIPEPRRVLSEAVRVLRPGGLIFIRDLCRPQTADQVEGFVKEYCGAETETAQQLFRQSLHAALTLDEIRSLVVDLGFSAEGVQMSSDRHWTWADRKATVKSID